MDRIDQMLKSIQNGIDSQSMSLLLGILGIAITIFTVVYSFMEATKERRRHLLDRANADANAGDEDPILRADLVFASQRLAELWKMNITIMAIIIADIAILMLFVVHIILKDVLLLWYIGLIAEVVLIAVCLITLSIYLTRYYKRFVNIVDIQKH